MFFGFAAYNVCCAFAYGEIIGSRIGDGWVAFHARPYWFSILLIVYLVMSVIFGGVLVRITQFVLLTLFAKNYQQAVELFLRTERLSESERAMLMGGACAKA